MSFAVAADAYDRFMGRFSSPLAAVFADFASITPEARVLDVGCGTGALTAELVGRLGSSQVAAVEPSPTFFASMLDRFPDVEVHQAPAEQVPFGDGEFDAALAELVVHFMTDPVAGLREMARVTRTGGTVAACVWDHEGGTGPLGSFWTAVHELDPDAHDEAGLAGARAGHLTELFGAAGLRDVVEEPIEVSIELPSFEAWWEPFTLGVGPAGAYVAGLDDDRRHQLRERCRAEFPEAPFGVTARAWAARGIV
jgi:SAM-dependent methyltransferase